MKRDMETVVERILAAMRFSGEKHGSQTRKGRSNPPYILHPVEVADLLWRIGKVRDPLLVVAALLHDTLEDTNTLPEEINARFGPDVLSLVREVSDDKRLEKRERKRLQVERAPHLTHNAKLIRLADKCCNIRELTFDPPVGWDEERKREYLRWAEDVVNGLRGAHPDLEAHFDALMKQAMEHIPL